MKKINDEHNYTKDDPWKEQFPKKKREKIEHVENTKFKTTSEGNYKLYLVKLKGLQDSNNTWINEKELMKDNASTLYQFISLN